MTQTLCWHCANAVPDKAGHRGCSWSRNFEPVPGWKADHRFIKQRNGKKYPPNFCETYMVHSCPQFQDDGSEEREEDIKNPRWAATQARE